METSKKKSHVRIGKIGYSIDKPKDHSNFNLKLNKKQIKQLYNNGKPIKPNNPNKQ